MTQRGVGDQIDRDDSLDLRRAGVQLPRNGRDRDIDDKGIDAEHECAATTIANTDQRREVSSGLETIWCGPEFGASDHHNFRL